MFGGEGADATKPLTIQALRESRDAQLKFEEMRRETPSFKEKLAAAVDEVRMKSPLARSLLRPDKSQVEHIVTIQLHPDKTLQDVKKFLSELLGLEEDAIPDNNKDLLEFASMQPGEMVDKICSCVTKAQVDAFLTDTDATLEDTPLWASHRPDRQVLEDILVHCGIGPSTTCTSDVQLVLSKLLELPEADIPAGHPEVQQYVGLSRGEMAARLCEVFSPEQCSKCRAATVVSDIAERRHPAQVARRGESKVGLGIFGWPSK